MKDLLESLEIEDGKLSKEQIKTIIAKNGEIVKNETEKAVKDKDEKIETYETKIKEMEELTKDNADWKTKFEELDAQIKEQEAKQEADRVEAEFNERFENLLDGKKFANDYTRKGLYSQFKEQLNLKENKGKGDKEIFDSLTKDINGLFESDNKVADMPEMGDSTTETTEREMPLIW